MTSVVQKLHSLGKIHPPSFVVGGTQYEVATGSTAYGVSGDMSDMDVYGWCIPPKDVVFPHLGGEIPGFGTQIQRFEQWQEHHIETEGGQYDVAVYNVVKYAQLCLENNPNMIDSLFVPQRCVLHATKVGQMFRDARKRFLHRGSWHKFKGYAYSQMKRISTEAQNKTGKRKDLIEKYGWDVKFGYHIVRLINEVKQILVTGDLDLEQNKEQLKAIRAGEWSLEQLHTFFNDQERALEEIYNTSKLPWGPKDGVEDDIRSLLLRVLEEHYGSLQGAVNQSGVAENKLRRIRLILEE